MSSICPGYGIDANMGSQPRECDLSVAALLLLSTLVSADPSPMFHCIATAEGGGVAGSLGTASMFSHVLLEDYFSVMDSLRTWDSCMSWLSDDSGNSAF